MRLVVRGLQIAVKVQVLLAGFLELSHHVIEARDHFRELPTGFVDDLQAIVREDSLQTEEFLDAVERRETQRDNWHCNGVVTVHVERTDRSLRFLQIEGRELVDGGDEFKVIELMLEPQIIQRILAALRRQRQRTSDDVAQGQ